MTTPQLAESQISAVAQMKDFPRTMERPGTRKIPPKGRQEDRLSVEDLAMVEVADPLVAADPRAVVDPPVAEEEETLLGTIEVEDRLTEEAVADGLTLTITMEETRGATVHRILLEGTATVHQLHTECFLQTSRPS